MTAETMEKIRYYETLNDKVHLAMGNTKIGKEVCALSLPAGITCRPDAPCKKGCYALKGRQMFPAVQGAYRRNLRLYNQDHVGFFKNLSQLMTENQYKFMRLFDSGDIINAQFFEEMILHLVLPNPQVKFMGFTKKYEIVNAYIKQYKALPDNLTIIFSNWDKNWHVDNPYHLPESYVNFKDKVLNPEIPIDAKECGGNCSACFKCWNLKANESVVFHQH